ncbi:hypothetical protein AB0A95_18595 [Micromonospora sp. NPDC049230]|uniref:hypothetical protein n=1 Tax=Micromonospora sp. NPDC049230 TaxID=3155502 RepID=UPI0033C2A83B
MSAIGAPARTSVPSSTSVRTSTPSRPASTPTTALAVSTEPDTMRRVVRLPVRLVIRGSTAPPQANA